MTCPRVVSKSVCCIVHKRFLELDSTTRTCTVITLGCTNSYARRLFANQTVKTKKEELVKWLNVHGPQATSLKAMSNDTDAALAKEVESLPWPVFTKEEPSFLADLFSAPKPNVFLGFENQVSIALGTAFMISNNCIATAAHVIDAIEEQGGLKEHVVVFDFKGDLTGVTVKGKPFPYFEMQG
jgi:hypothetical protein